MGVGVGVVTRHLSRVRTCIARYLIGVSICCILPRTSSVHRANFQYGMIRTFNREKKVRKDEQGMNTV